MIRRKFNELQFKNAVEISYSISETMKKLGMCGSGGGAYRTFERAAKEFNVDFSHFTGKNWSYGKKLPPRTNIDNVLKKGKYYPTHSLKKRLLFNGILDKKCSVCNNSEWMGKEIPVQLDHIDGDNTNNELSNLRILCPNCHAQTDTWCGKNRKKRYFNYCKLCKAGIKSARVYCEKCFKERQYNKFLSKKRVIKKARPTKIDWPAKEELAAMVWSKPSSSLAKELGVSDKAIQKKCKKLKIKKPPRGYWAKLDNNIRIKNK